MLGNLFGGRRGGGMSPITMALVGLLAYRTLKGKGRLAEMLGNRGAGNAPGANPFGGNAGAPDPRAAGGGWGGLLGGLLGGGAAGGLLGGGLNDLLGQFREAGQAEKAQSWVARGPNAPLSPGELEQALGEEKIAWLMQETGLTRQELLDGLSRELPDTVDKLTPEGRVPEEKEMGKAAM